MKQIFPFTMRKKQEVLEDFNSLFTIISKLEWMDGYCTDEDGGRLGDFQDLGNIQSADLNARGRKMLPVVNTYLGVNVTGTQER